jgi:ferredoxin
MRVTIDRSKCVGSGNCMMSAPAVFEQDDDGLVVLLNPAPPEGEEAAVRQAVELCPARVISVD